MKKKIKFPNDVPIVAFYLLRTEKDILYVVLNAMRSCSLLFPAPRRTDMSSQSDLVGSLCFYHAKRAYMKQ